MSKTNLPEEIKIVQKQIERLLTNGEIKIHLKDGLLCSICNKPVTQKMQNKKLIVKCAKCKKEWR